MKENESKQNEKFIAVKQILEYCELKGSIT